MIRPPIDSVPNEKSDSKTLDFVQEAIREGDDFVSSQKGYKSIQKTIDAIMAEDKDERPRLLSRTKTNRIAKIAEELRSMSTDTKPFWEYATQNPRYQKQAQNLGGLSVHWWLQRGIDQKFADSVVYSYAGGSGWSYQYYNHDIDDIDVSSEDPRDVLPIRPSASVCSAQECMGIILRRARTVNYVRNLFPGKAHLIQTERDGASEPPSAMGRAMSWLTSPFYLRLNQGQEPANKIPKIPTLDLFTIYLRDDRLNETGGPVAMGEFDQDGQPLNNWSYIVMPGEKLYPRKRKIVCTRRAVLSDGPSEYWHGMFPFSKLTLFPVPFSGCWLGKGILWDLLPLQESLHRMLRVFDDHWEKFARPDLVVDSFGGSRAEFEKIDTRRAGLKLWQKAMGGKGNQLVYPQAIEPLMYEYVKFIIAEMDADAGVHDMANLTRLGQLPSADTVEKIMESMSYAVKGRSRVIEAFMREFAEMLAFNFAQFYPPSLVEEILGPDSRTPDDVDSDPGTFIPDYVHAGDLDENGVPTPEARARGYLPRYERAKVFIKQFKFNVQPGSLLAASEIERKLLYLQLARAGLIDTQTLLEKLDIPNVQEIMQRRAGEQMQQMMTGLGGMNVNPAGRKASGQQMPRMKISESG